MFSQLCEGVPVRVHYAQDKDHCASKEHTRPTGSLLDPLILVVKDKIRLHPFFPMSNI